jgi:hypothetical protein
MLWRHWRNNISLGHADLIALVFKSNNSTFSVFEEIIRKRQNYPARYVYVKVDVNRLPKVLDGIVLK